MTKRVNNQQVTLKVLLKNKRTCCVCHAPDRAVQVHHIDGNSANTVQNNLAVLCLSHHDQATAGLVKGNVGLGVKLSPIEVRMHKSAWEEAVANELRPQQRTAIETQIPRFEIHKTFEKAYTEHASDLGQPSGEAEPIKHAYLAQYDKAQVIWNENAGELYRLHMKKNVWAVAKDLRDDDLTWFDDSTNGKRFNMSPGQVPPWGGPARLRAINPKDWSIGSRRWHFYHTDGATFVQRFEAGLIIGPFRRFPSDKDGAQVYALTGELTDSPRWYTSVSFEVSELPCIEPMSLVQSSDVDGGPMPYSRHEAAEEIRGFYDLLTPEEKRVLRFILPLGRSPTNLNVGQITALESVQQKTGFVGRNFTTGSYELNPQTIGGLKILLPLDAGLYGKIICREIKLVLNTKDKYYDCFFITQVRLTTDGPPTMVSHWQLDLYWQGVEYPSVRQPVADYYVKRPIQHAENPSINFQKQPLIEFPANEEITSANQKLGWLHFSIWVLPIDAVGDFGHLHKDFTLKLQVFDNRETSYVIYEGLNEGLSGCGTIERPKN